MIEIERLRLRLPQGFEHRATAIARLVGEALATRHLAQDQVFEAISVAPQRLPLNTSDSEIASRIVAEMVTVIEGRTA